MSKENELEDAHNRGEIDSSNDAPRDLPYGAGSRLVNEMLSIKTIEEMEEVNDAYREGYDHATSQKDGCFLTTACVEYAGLPDNCHELTVLRSFRNNYVARLAHGPAVLAEYYEIAPALVRQIEQSTERKVILAGIFATVNKAVVLIERGNYQEAFICYEAMFADLKKRHYVCA